MSFNSNKSKDLLKILGMGAVATMATSPIVQGGETEKKPNIIYIFSDDLGWNELGCYGQQKIKTPSLDKMAEEGMRFTQAYSGSPVCAPSRACLMQGRHTGHAYIRDNGEVGSWYDYEGQAQIPDSVYTIAEMLKEVGYTTGMVGKWGLGGPGPNINNCPSIPTRQGFEFYYGNLCQKQAHQYYPTYLWKNAQKDPLNNPDFIPHQKFPSNEDANDPANYEKYKGEEWTEDKIAEEALDFIRQNQDTTFFLYYASPVPHVALQAPDSAYEPYIDEFNPDKPYDGGNSYLPHRYPHSCYAGMITRFDQHVGNILSLLKELGIDSNTLVVYSSDNGTTFNGGCDAAFFNSVGPLRGLKCQVYEGGIRVPMIARWPGKIKPGMISGLPTAIWDMLPTFAEAAECIPPRYIDGISILPTLLGSPQDQKEHEWLYWEYATNKQAVIIGGKWKCVRNNSKDNPNGDVELYNLENDISESNNIASSNPEICDSCTQIMKHGRTESDIWTLFPSYNFDPWEWGNDPVSVNQSPKNINGSFLYQSYPNPFNKITKVNYYLPKDAKVSLRIYNASGRRVRTLVNKRQVKGSYTFVWDVRDGSDRLVKSGTYFSRLKVDGRVQIRKMLLVK